MTTMRLDDLGTFTTLESNKSPPLLQVIPPVEHHSDTTEADRPQGRLRGALWGDDCRLERRVESGIELDQQTGALVQRKRAEGAVLKNTCLQVSERERVLRYRRF